jgi:small subunit ribosomal protein S20
LATHKSAEKRARQSVRRTARNKAVLGTVRTTEKKLRAALASGDAKTAQDTLKAYMSKATKAASKGVIKAQQASRKVAQLSAHVAKLASK